VRVSCILSCVPQRNFRLWVGSRSGFARIGWFFLFMVVRTLSQRLFAKQWWSIYGEMVVDVFSSCVQLPICTPVSAIDPVSAIEWRATLERCVRVGQPWIRSSPKLGSW